MNWTAASLNTASTHFRTHYCWSRTTAIPERSPVHSLIDLLPYFYTVFRSERLKSPLVRWDPGCAIQRLKTDSSRTRYINSRNERKSSLRHSRNQKTKVPNFAWVAIFNFDLLWSYCKLIESRSVALLDHFMYAACRSEGATKCETGRHCERRADIRKTYPSNQR